ncbi:MAG: gliding motility-associated ABC transporter ATP-binding subunit GldA [Eudoraea sp.]|nr:gliding motility-associated ABC transporter ATP-binding subunit GldA [Eudoraea sp.]
MSIQVSNISKIFGQQLALDDISFRIEKGEIVGFLGPNGAGKSTMMRILTTYLNADKGSALVNGHSISDAPRAVQNCIGYLPENNPLYPEMYVREYLRFQADFFKIGKEAIEAVIEQTGLLSEANKKIRQLSKGYKQRVGLAAALLHDPEVLILDEPTTGLDPNQLVEIRKLIREIGKNKTILLSTHILKEVEAVCDRVIIINKGSLVADSSLQALREEQGQRIEVEFDYRVEEVLLQQLPNVTSVKNIDGFIYEISFESEKDMRSVVFDFAHDNELKILQLSRKNISLEHLFTDLTS